MCMNGKCGRCGAACKAPEPKTGVDRGGPMKGDRVTGGPTRSGVGLDVAKKKAAEAALAKARTKR